MGYFYLFFGVGGGVFNIILRLNQEVNNVFISKFGDFLQKF